MSKIKEIVAGEGYLQKDDYCRKCDGPYAQYSLTDDYGLGELTDEILFKMKPGMYVQVVYRFSKKQNDFLKRDA